MQETRTADGSFLKEFFTGDTDDKVFKKMNNRLHELMDQGHTLIKRVNIGRNDPCPCGSGLKFKKCCIDKCK